MVGLKDFDMPSCCNSCELWSINHDDEPVCDLTYEYIENFHKRQNSCPLAEAILKDQYEARLKADMVAMLTEIQLEIEEIVTEETLIDKEWANGLHYSEKIIQQKINKLKEVEQ